MGQDNSTAADYMQFYYAVFYEKGPVRLLDRYLNDCTEPQNVSRLKNPTFAYSDEGQVKVVSENNVCTITKDGTCTLSQLAPRWKHHTTLRNGYFVGEKPYITNSVFSLFRIFDEKTSIYEIKPPNDVVLVQQVISIDDNRFAINFREDEDLGHESQGVIIVYNVDSPTPIMTIKSDMTFQRMEPFEGKIKLVGNVMHEVWDPSTGARLVKQDNDSSAEALDMLVMGNDMTVKVDEKKIQVFNKKNEVLREYCGTREEKYAFSTYEWQSFGSAQKIDDFIVLVERKRKFGEFTGVDWVLFDIRDEPLQMRERANQSDIPKLIIRRDLDKKAVVYVPSATSTTEQTEEAE